MLEKTINRLIKQAVRTWFALMSRERASRIIQKQCERYLALAGRVDSRQGSLLVRVPKMPGVDEDMRNWSLGTACGFSPITWR